MNTSRLEAFSDGVLAIIITIMVLELSAPEEPSWEGLRQVLPIFLSYLLSFAFVGIYWINHHHLVHLAGKVNGTVLWANLHLLFWLSLIPFSTRWMQQTDFAQVPVLTYGIDLLLSAVAFLMLRGALVLQDGPDGHLARALRDDRKGKLSPALSRRDGGDPRPPVDRAGRLRGRGPHVAAPRAQDRTICRAAQRVSSWTFDAHGANIASPCND